MHTHYPLWFSFSFQTYDLTKLIEQVPVSRHMGRHCGLSSGNRQSKLLSIHISKYSISQINSHRFEVYTIQAYLEAVN